MADFNMSICNPIGIVHEAVFNYLTLIKENSMDTIDQTLNDRGKHYGSFVGYAKVTQELKKVIAVALSAKNKVLADDQQEALDMIVHKIGRIVNGDPNYADSWVDIAGYAKLVADRLEGIE